MKLLHIGIPSTQRGENDEYIAELKWQSATRKSILIIGSTFLLMRTLRYGNHETATISPTSTRCGNRTGQMPGSGVTLHDIGPEILAFGSRMVSWWS